MVTTTRDDYSNRDYTKGDYPTFNDIEYQAEMETYLKRNPLARVALKSIMNTTKGDVSKVLQNVDDDDDSKDLWTKIYGVSSSVPGYIGVPSDPDKFQQYSEEEQNINPIMRIKLSSLDSDKQKTVTGHELGHFGLRVLLDEGFIDKKLFDKLQLPDKEKPKVSTEERLMHKLSSRDDYFAGTKDTGFLSNNISKTLDSIAEDYLSGIAKEDLGYAKGGDVGEGYATDNYKQFRERNTPVSVKPNTDFINAVPEGLGSLNWGEILEESIPGVGETIIADSLADNIKNKEFKDAAIDGIALAMGVIPFVGDVASKSIRQLKGKKGTLEKPLNFKKAQKNKKKKKLQGRVQEDITERMKIYGQAEQNALNKFTDTFGGFGDLKVGDRIEGVTVGGTKTSHKIKGLTVSPIGGRLEGSEKRIKVYIKRYKTLHKEKIKQGIFPKEPTLIYDETSKITLRPLVKTIRNDGTEGGLYYDMISHKGINKFGIKKYAKGGDTMPMEQQMEMFAVGGLDDDGLSRDPVSGNEIPPGSMANEVRDDVEARLSDGEYVVPANVVRFFGVKFFEDLRTQAMQGLADMEANGRIGGQPVPADMPMQDQMAQGQPPISEGEMEMLQSMMNKGGYIQGYQTGGTPDFENPSNYPFNPSPFLTVGGSYLSPNNPNVTPDPNLPPTTMPVDPSPSPESGISMVTMVNPATGEIQVVQFMGGNPVDQNTYNQLLSSGFFIQGSPELAAYKQRIAEDNREEPDTTTRPHPMDANVMELGKIIAESSKGGGSLFEMIPGVTGAVTGKLALDHQNDITRALAKTIADTELSTAQRNVAQLLQNAWLDTSLTSKERKDLIAKAGIHKQPSIKNALGAKAGEYMSENWFGTATKEQIEKRFGDKATTDKAVEDALDLTEKRFEVNKDPVRGERFYGSEDDFVIDGKDYRFGEVKDPTDLDPFGGSGPDVDSSGGIADDSNNNNDDNNAGGGSTNFEDFTGGQTDKGSGSTAGGFGGTGKGRSDFNKGGLLEKPTKKKKTKTKK